MKENSIKNERSSIEEAVKTMERWVEYEKNNKDKINKADELIYIQETILSDYKRVLKENEQLKNENKKLKYKIKGQECVIETQAHNEEVYESIFERLEKENKELKNALM